MENLLTAKEIALKIGLSRRQLQKKIIRQMFETLSEKEFAEKVNGKWLFSLSKVLEFIQKGK